MNKREIKKLNIKNVLKMNVHNFLKNAMMIV